MRRSSSSGGGPRPPVAKPREVRHHERFAADVRAHLRWLVRHRSAEDVDRLRVALRRLRRRLASYPGIGESIARRGTTTVRVVPLGGRLPFLVWYLYDEGGPHSTVWLMAFGHERQDRERFDLGDL